MVVEVIKKRHCGCMRLAQGMSRLTKKIRCRVCLRELGLDMCAQELRSAADCSFLKVEKSAGYSTALFHCAYAVMKFVNLRGQIPVMITW